MEIYLVASAQKLWLTVDRATFHIRVSKSAHWDCCGGQGARLGSVSRTIMGLTSVNARAFYVHMQHRYCCIMGL